MIPGGVHCEGDTALALGPQVEDNLILTREAETEGQGDTDCLGAGAQWTLTREQAGPSHLFRGFSLNGQSINCYPTSTLPLSNQSSCSQTQAMRPRTTVVSFGHPPQCAHPKRERSQSPELPWDTWKHLPPRSFKASWA